jgi:hypothetical protein
MKIPSSGVFVVILLAATVVKNIVLPMSGLLKLHAALANRLQIERRIIEEWCGEYVVKPC